MIRILTLLASAGILAGAASRLPPVPPAIPEVCADRDDIQAVLHEYFALLTGPAGQDRDWNRFDALFLSTARIHAIGVNVEGENELFPQTVDEYTHHIMEYVAGTGYYHQAEGWDIRCEGRLADAVARFESANHPTGPVIDRGEIRFHLLRKDEAWRIAHVMWHSETG